MISSGKTYELGSVSKNKLSALQETFSNLPPDPYADERLRSRRYSCFLYENGKLKRTDKKKFMQSSQINDYLGDVEREYEDLEDSVLEDKAFVEMVEKFLDQTGISKDSLIEAHQIRWHCRLRTKDPAPEGNHQDGFDYISVILANEGNITGGDIMVFPEKHGDPLYRKKLNPGEFVIINDREVFHNASKIEPIDSDKEGFWDVIVLTANDKARQESEAA